MKLDLSTARPQQSPTWVLFWRRTINSVADLIQQPARRLAEFPLAQVFRKMESKSKVPFAEVLMAGLNAALLEHVLNIPATACREVSLPDDGHWNTVAAGSGVSHCGSAQPTMINATRPCKQRQHAQEFPDVPSGIGNFYFHARASVSAMPRRSHRKHTLQTLPMVAVEIDLSSGHPPLACRPHCVLD